MEMIGFEAAADYKDLHVDGSNWMEMFGGSTGPSRPKVGGRCCCGPITYVLFRWLMAGLSIFALVYQLKWTWEADGGLYGTELTHWTVLVCLLYLVLAALLTTMAVTAEGEVTDGMPPLVLLCSVLYAAALPLALINALCFWMFLLPEAGTAPWVPGATVHAMHVVVTTGPPGLMLLDTLVNRQPYYASFHGLLGAAACWAYLLFTVLYWALGGQDRVGNRYIYHGLDWGTGYQSSKMGFVLLMLLLPLFFVTFWFLVWARRRVHVAMKPPPL
jgi:hypothetical protein